MRKKRERIPSTGEDTQYCILCATEMPFECIEAADHEVDEPDEWICVKCGSALLIDPPLQQLNRTA